MEEDAKNADERGGRRRKVKMWGGVNGGSVDCQISPLNIRIVILK